MVCCSAGERYIIGVSLLEHTLAISFSFSWVEVVTRKEDLDMIVWKAICLEALFRYSIAMVVIVANRIAVLYLASHRRTYDNGQSKTAIEV